MLMHLCIWGGMVLVATKSPRLLSHTLTNQMHDCVSHYYPPQTLYNHIIVAGIKEDIRKEQQS